MRMRTVATCGADCRAAGIERSDSAGRVVDVHALRHTFGTMLAKAGVSLQVAQKAMRHSTPTLTANIYTHLTLVDTADAVNELPSLTASAGEHAAQNVANLVTPTVTPKSDVSWCNRTKIDNRAMFNPNRGTVNTDRISTNKDNGLQR
ncbi:MAG TPA: tyrosine-type recombinase/integrase [Candidatus Hydrogenedentes bacterium]|nr:tyrosine-type recombinase/integrase [Candidatus Hydrogenedentota bacterium]